MESNGNVIDMSSWMASVNLKHAFHSFSVKIDHQTFLKFLWNMPYYCTGIPNEDVNAMNIFTKILKLSFSLLRKLGHQSVVYIDKTFLIGPTFIECAQKIDT